MHHCPTNGFHPSMCDFMFTVLEYSSIKKRNNDKHHTHTLYHQQSLADGRESSAQTSFSDLFWLETGIKLDSRSTDLLLKNGSRVCLIYLAHLIMQYYCNKK